MEPSAKPTTTFTVVRVFVGDLFVLAVLFLVTEGVVRLVAPQSVHRLLRHVFEATDGGYHFKGGVSVVCNNGYGDHVFSINSWRARDREYGPKQSGEWRILCLGDSYNENQALEVEDIWPNVLESDLAVAYPDRTFSVVNAGQAGWGLWEYHDYLEEMLPAIDPDVVVMVFANAYDMVNHAQRPESVPKKIWAGLPIRKNASLLGRARFAVWYANEMMEGWSHAYVALRRATFYPGIWTGITRVPGLRRIHTDADYGEGLVEPTTEVLKRIKGLCDERHVRLVVMSVPWEEECIPSAARLRIELERPDVSKLDFTRPVRLLKMVVAAAGVPLYDPAPALALAEDRTYFVVFRHWNELGNRVVAGGLRRFLETHRLLGD